MSILPAQPGTLVLPMAHDTGYGGQLAPWLSKGENSKAPQDLLPKPDGYPQISDQQFQGSKASRSVAIDFIEKALAAFPMHDPKSEITACAA